MNPSWKDLGALIDRRTRTLPEADREDLRQDLLLRNLEMHRAERIEPYPAYCYALSVLPHRIAKARALAINRTDLEWDSWYSIDPETAIDLKQQILYRPTRQPRTMATGDDLTGHVFGDWHVESRAENDRHGRRRWNLVCLVCEEQHVAITAHLKRGAVRHCTKTKGERLKLVQPLGVEAARSARAMECKKRQAHPEG